MRRRRYRWADIAAVARSTPGVWRQHRDLVAITEHTYRHLRRRVRALQPDARGTFHYRRGHAGHDHLGRVIFDLRIRYEEHPDGKLSTQGPQEGGREVRAEAGEDADAPARHGSGARSVPTQGTVRVRGDHATDAR